MVGLQELVILVVAILAEVTNCLLPDLCGFAFSVLFFFIWDIRTALRLYPVNGPIPANGVMTFEGVLFWFSVIHVGL